MKQRLQRFMQGRYGADQLSRALIYLVLLLFIIPIFTRGWVDVICTGLGWLGWIFVMYRMFSKNYSKRWAENQKYLSFVNRIKGNFYRQKSYAQQRKTHHIYKCPGCGQKIRIPKGKGKIEIRCPKCRTTFVKRS